MTGAASDIRRVETLFLDAGGVLVFPNWTRVADALNAHGVRADAAALTAAEPRAKQRLDFGETIRSTDDQRRGWLYMDLVLAEAGVERSAASDAALGSLREYQATQNLWETVPDDVRPALERLRAMGLRLVVVSNANGTLDKLFARLALDDHFDVLLDSHLEGVEKPDPRLFHIALERAGARAESTVHVGDLYHVDVVGARAAGLGAVLLDAASLYGSYDCPRVRNLPELADLLTTWQALG